MTRPNRMPADLLRGLRDQEERARDTGLLYPDTPRAEDDDWNYWIIPNPMVYEDTERGSQRYDLYSRLLKDRIIFMGSEVNDRVANLITAQLLFLEMQDPEKDVNFYINSPGGVVTSGLAIYDTMQFIRCDVATVCIGQAASMGSILLLAGAADKRSALPHARIMIHQPSGGMRGQASDMEIQYHEMIHLRDRIYHLMASHTGRTYDEILEACDRDRFMSPEEAQQFGIIDQVIEKPTGVTSPTPKD